MALTEIPDVEIRKMYNRKTGARTVVTVLLLTAMSWHIHAEEQSLQEQVDEIKAQIKQEEARKEQLSSEITSREEEVTDLRKKLEELEKKTGG